MNILQFAFFGLATLLVLLGALVTVAARNPIRGAMGLLTSIIGIAAMYLQLAAEFLAAIQIIVYAGAVVVLFIFVIMLLGPSATSPKDARGAVPRYLGAGVLLASAVGALTLLARASGAPTSAFPDAPATFGTIEGVGGELFTLGIVPFEIAGLLLLVAVVAAVAVARGRMPDASGSRALTPEPNVAPEPTPEALP